MTFIIDTTKKSEINLNPATVYEEIIQNLHFLYSSIEFDIPLDRALGLNPIYVDRTIETAKALAIADIYEKTEKYEPRAEVVNIDFNGNKNGMLKAVIEVDINGGYYREDYSG